MCIGQRQPHTHRHKCGAQTRLHCLADCIAVHWQNEWWKRCKSKHMSTTIVHQMTMQCMHVMHIMQWAALLFVNWFVCSFTSVVKGCLIAWCCACSNIDECSRHEIYVFKNHLIMHMHKIIDVQMGHVCISACWHAMCSLHVWTCLHACLCIVVYIHVLSN